jgi:hypothetical protein
MPPREPGTCVLAPEMLLITLSGGGQFWPQPVTLLAGEESRWLIW